MHPLDLWRRCAIFGCGNILDMPRPTAFDFQHERPVQESSNQNETGQYAKALESQFQCDCFDDVSRNENLQPQKQGAANLNTVLVVTRIPRCLVEKTFR